MRRPTMWPQRPKRLPDELFSSWLWRAAVAAGAPPRRFALDALEASYADIDRDIGEATVHRLALSTGQSFSGLANATLSAVRSSAQTSRSGVVQDTALQDDRLLLVSTRRGRPRGRPPGLLQYCPQCLAEDARPYFRRGWRFTYEVACTRHRRRLHDACWQCGAPIAILEQTMPSHQPACASCGAVLAEGRSKPAHDVARRQQGLACLLYYLAVEFAPAQQRIHLDCLARHFPPQERVAARAGVIAQFRAQRVLNWFGEPAQQRHRPMMRRLAEGRVYDRLFSARDGGGSSLVTAPFGAKNAVCRTRTAAARCRPGLAPAASLAASP
jgi:TniQ